MICILRCDANLQLGLGHFSRCLSLANALVKYHVECIFIMQNPDSSIQNTLHKNHHNLLMLPNTKAPFDQIHDRKQCKKLIDDLKLFPNLIIIDHYQLSSLWWHNFRKRDCKLFVLNDTSDTIDDVDYVWQMAPIKNQSATNVKPYLPIIFSGPKYLLLKEEFQQEYIKPSSATRQVLISIGATDPDNTSEFLISTIHKLLPDVTMTLMTTSLNPHIPLVKENFSYDTLHFCIDPPHVAKIMQQHDIIITAAGTMMWEAFSLGVPVLIMKNHPNQQTNIDLITPLLAELYLGEEQNLSAEQLIKIIQLLLTNIEKRIDIQEKINQLCDGKGCQRVAKKLMENNHYG